MISKRRLFIAGLVAVAGLAMSPATSFAESNADVAKAIMDITYSAWKADMAKDTAASMAIIADDYTEFNAETPVRVDGKAMTETFYAAGNQSGDTLLAAEMLNPKVQVYGDVAILSYNYVGMTKDKDGEISTNLAKSTRVYAKRDGAWKLVHANFAPVASDD